MPKTRVLVVEDSLTIRKYLVETLASAPDFEVVAEAENGRQAIEYCEKLRPDVLSLDMMMPVLDGLAATEYIMAYCPTPILIVSASVNRGEVFKTYDALNAGAVDVLEKPTGMEANGEWVRNYRQALKTVSHIKVITHPRARLAGRKAPPPRAPLPTEPTGGAYRAVAIGASTGGPGAVVSILQALPPSFSLPIFLVIHISAAFGGCLTDWLNTVSPLPVRNAQNGEPVPPPGTPGVISPPPDRHLLVRQDRLWTTADPERHFCRPSVDVLFESLAREMGDSVIACLLTGMGRDGAEGLLAIKRAGGMTLAQDEASSVVYGMPREAVLLNAARQVLNLGSIGPALLQLAQPQIAQRGIAATECNRSCAL